jgi:hypothetical protein
VGLAARRAGLFIAPELAGRAQLAARDVYIVIEQSPAMTASTHDRRHAGLNHLASYAGDRARVDNMTTRAPDNGWKLLFRDRHPYAGGTDHYAAYLANTDSYEVELVATNP